MAHTIIQRAVLGAIALVLAVAGWFGWQSYTVYRGIQRITDHPVPRTTEEPKISIPPLDGNHRINILVLGSDNDRKIQEARPLAQSMIIVTIDPRDDKVGMLSIPRDFYVPIRGHGMGKIDLAYKYGQVALARETVERLFHIPIDYYAWVGLTGFIKVVDTFNGVTLDVQYPILDDGYPNDLSSQNPYGYQRVFIPAGWQHLDGIHALEYVRSRHGDIIGDFGRSYRQQQILLRLDQKINAMNVITHLPQLVLDLQDSVRTDLSLMQLYQFARLSRHIHRQDVTQVVLQAPTYSRYGTAPDGESIVIPEWSKIRPVVKSMFAPILAVPATPAARRQVPSSTPAAKPAHASQQSVAVTPQPTPTVSPKVVPTTSPSLTRAPGTLIYVQGGNLYETRANGVTRQLTKTGDAAMPAVSPDGRSVVYVRMQHNVSDLWVMNLRTGVQRELTHDTNPLGVAQPDVRNNLWAAWPTWAPDGQHIVFSWDRAKLQQPPADARPVALALWEVAADGGSPVQLTHPATGGAGDTDAVWRPRSHQVLYVRWDNLASTAQPYSQLEILDTHTGRSWALTPVGGRVVEPSWSPSGQRVTYVRRTPAGMEQVVVAPVHATAAGPTLGPRTVIAAGAVAQPAFTPSGRSISYLSAVGDGFALDVAPLTGGTSRQYIAAGSALDARWRAVWLG